ncbi:SH3-domain-containing protein [Leucogyrophana mollusca]|uniref:SH3-domain-containing protein n=1 Tax=Leucogyrophana mollusca TaxID=85980 RepID=A0ACB8BS04_9AGAM|nr:SH3-domain-containing protein [Leucogyrophana mollusca]
MVESSVVFSHIISQTRENVQFLLSHHQISEADGRDILARLPVAGTSIDALAQQTRRLAMSPVPSTTGSNVSSAKPLTIEARAIWDWSSEDPNDVSFNAGDIIEIISETNEDWWTGRHKGKQGLFPSNYVEKIKRASTPPSFHEFPRPTSPYGSLYGDQKYPPPGPLQYLPGPGPPQSPYQPPPGPPQSQYQPPPGPPQSQYQPPPPHPQGGYQGPPQGAAYNPYITPVPDNTLSQAQKPPKKNRFGGLGSTMAQSAAGGVGFGAGSAVGSGIINSIF